MPVPKTVKDLIPSPYNPRKISAAQLSSLKDALAVFGDLGGIVFNRRTGRLVGGHQRVKTLDPAWMIQQDTAALSEQDIKTGTVAHGWIETEYGRLAYREVDWDEQTEKAANIAANRHGGTWDDARLKELLVGLDDGSPLLGLTGFDAAELDALIARGEAALRELPSTQDQQFEQVTFTLTKAQASLIRAALAQAMSSGPFENTGNANHHGNALARIAARFMRA